MAAAQIDSTQRVTFVLIGSMFKKLIVPSLSSAASSALSPYSANSSSSKSVDTGDEEEEITKLEIPTLMRRHSFGFTTDNSMLEPPTGDSTDLSIDPFESNTPMKRSKSFHFEIPKKSSLASLKKKPKKSVRFNDSFRSLRYSNMQHNLNSNTPRDFSGIQKALQRFFQYDDNSISGSLNDGKDLEEIRQTDEDAENNDNDFLGTLTENEDVLKDSNKTVDPKDLILMNNDVEPEFNSELQSPVLDVELNDDSAEFLNSTDQQQQQSASSNKNIVQRDEFLELDSLLKGLINKEYDNNDRKQQAKDNLLNIFNELNSEYKFTEDELGEQDMVTTLDEILTDIKCLKENLNERDLTIAQLSLKLSQNEATAENLTQVVTQNRLLENRISDYEDSICNYSSNNEVLKSKLNQSSKQIKHLTELVHDLESKQVLTEARYKTETEELKKLKTILNDRLNVTVKFDEYLVQLLDDRDEYETSVFDLVSQNEALKDTLASSEIDNKNMEIKLAQLLREKDEILSMQNTDKLSHQAEISIYVQEINNLSSELRYKTNLEIQKDIQMQNLNQDLLTLNQKISQLTKEIMELKDSINRSMGKINQTLNDLKTANLELTRLQDKDQQNLNIQDANEIKIKTLSNQLMEKEDMANELNVCLINLKSEVSDKAQLITELNFKLSDMCKKVEATSKENSELEENNKFIVEKYSELSRIMEDLKVKFSHMESSKCQLTIKHNQYVSSNALLLQEYQDLVGKLRQALKSMMYENSASYLTRILEPLETMNLVKETNLELFKEINSFIGKAVKDLVTNYIENERVLEKELKHKENIYEEVFNKVSAAFFGKFGVDLPSSKVVPLDKTITGKQKSHKIPDKQKYQNTKDSFKQIHSSSEARKPDSNSLEFDTELEPRSLTESEFEVSATGTGSLSTSQIPKYLNRSYRVRRKK